MQKGALFALSVLLLLSFSFALDPWNDPDQSATMSKCGEKCNADYMPGLQACLDTAMACGMDCTPIDDYAAREACNNECERKQSECNRKIAVQYNTCMKLCMNGTNIPTPCIDLYDIDNMQIYSQCVYNWVMVNVPQIPPGGGSGTTPGGGTGPGTGDGKTKPGGGGGLPPAQNKTVCGNGVCEKGEEQNCTADCPKKPTCGNGVCEGNETWSCPDDCKKPVCGNHICEPPTENYGNCPQDCNENCSDGIDNDLDTLVDCADQDCKSNVACQPITGTIITDDLEGARPVRGARVSLRWSEPLLGTTMYPESEAVYADRDGKFSIMPTILYRSGVATPTLVVRFIDVGYVNVTETGNLAPEAFVDLNLTSLRPGVPLLVNISAARTTNAWGNTPHVRDDSKIFTHTMEAKDYAINLLSANPLQQLALLRQENIVTFIPYRVNVSHSLHTWHDANGYGEIHIDDRAAVYNSNEAPGNREYHEYSHHIMNTVWGTAVPPWHMYRNGSAADVNHGGFVNHCSSDAWIEGFAEFDSLAINIQTSVPKRCVAGGVSASTYCWAGTGTDLEQNLQAQNDEEFAVAGILWDLYDNAGINRNGLVDDDNVSLTIPQLWATISKVRNFKAYYPGDISPRHIWYVRDLYDALKEDNIGQTDSDHDGVNDLDQIFAMHGYAYYNAPYGKWIYGCVSNAAGTVRY